MKWIAYLALFFCLQAPAQAQRLQGADVDLWN